MSIWRFRLLSFARKRLILLLIFITLICMGQLLWIARIRFYFDSIFYEDDVICNESLNLAQHITAVNASASETFRLKIDLFCRIRDHAFFNQDTLKEEDENLSEFQPGKSIKIPKELYSIMYKENIFQKSLFRTCAVVGNGGVLKGSECGEEIDSADIVFRCNLAPLMGHTSDVGYKSNITSMNPSIIHNYYHYLKTASDQENFSNRLQYIGNQYLLIWVFVHSNEYQQLKSFAEYHNKSSSKTKVLLVNHDVKRLINRFWIEQENLKATLPSTGLYLTTMALAACKHVTLYGFYPCMKGPNEEQLAYHYYETTHFATRTNGHQMSEEYKMLKDLEKQGILSLRYHCGPDQSRV